MLGLWCKKTYGTMKKIDDRYDDGDADGYEDRNDKDNAASG